MNLAKFSSGVNTSFSVELNNNMNLVLSNIGYNTIRQLLENSIIFNASGGEWAEGYLSSSGRLGSASTTGHCENIPAYSYSGSSAPTISFNHVSKGPTTDTNYQSDTDHTVQTWSDTSNAFEDNITTYASASSLGSSNKYFEHAIGKTFTSKYVHSVYIKFYWYQTAVSGAGGGASSLFCGIEKYDGSTWSTVTTFNNPLSGTYRRYSVGQYVLVDDTVQGLRFRMHTSGTIGADFLDVYSFRYGTLQPGIITHNISTNHFNSGLNSSFGTALTDYWEEGVNIQYKLRNDTESEETSWLNTNEIISFSSLTHPPDQCIVRVIPSSSSPTPGYPSIKGFWVTG